MPNLYIIKSIFAVCQPKTRPKNGWNFARSVCYDEQKPTNGAYAYGNCRKLYYLDAHQKTFTAAVLSCVAGKHGYDVVLDRTCFYPEGGGQPGDTGSLSGVRVTDTHERGDEIVHFCDAPLAVGETVEGAIDYDRRFSFMQLHSGEHILSGIVHRRFGYENVGFHMGTDFVTIDFSGMLGPDDLAAVEAEANEWIWKNIPIRITWPSPDELAAIPYRSKKELTGQVRIVTIPDVRHLRLLRHARVRIQVRSALVKIFSCVKFHDGVRLEILCGTAGAAVCERTRRAEPPRVRASLGKAFADRRRGRAAA